MERGCQQNDSLADGYHQGCSTDAKVTSDLQNTTNMTTGEKHLTPSFVFDDCHTRAMFGPSQRERHSAASHTVRCVLRSHSIITYSWLGPWRELTGLPKV